MYVFLLVEFRTKSRVEQYIFQLSSFDVADLNFNVDGRSVCHLTYTFKTEQYIPQLAHFMFSEPTLQSISMHVSLFRWHSAENPINVQFSQQAVEMKLENTIHAESFHIYTSLTPTRVLEIAASERILP